MMAAVDLMKAPPLLRRDRAEDGMIFLNEAIVYSSSLLRSSLDGEKWH